MKQCPYEDDDQEEEIAPPTRRWPRPNILDEDEEEEPFNTPESSAEHALFITQQDPDPHHEPGTLSCTQKGKTPATRKRPSSTTNIWASFGLSAESSTSARNSAPAAREKPRQLIPSNQSNQQGNDARLRKRSTRKTRKAYRPPHVLWLARSQLWTILHASDLSNKSYCRTH